MGKRQRLNLDEFFTFTPPTEEQKERMRNVRTAAGEFARVIAENVEPCADRGLAIAWTRNAMFSANSGVIHGDANAGNPDQGLPEAPSTPDNELPGGPTTPGNTLPPSGSQQPGWPVEPDQGLPEDPSYPDNTLPGEGATPKKKK